MILACSKIHIRLSILFFFLFCVVNAQQVELSEHYKTLIKEKEFELEQKEQLFDSLLQLKNAEVDSLKLIKIYREFFKEALNQYDLEKALGYTEKIQTLALELNVFDTDDIKKNHRNRIDFLGRNKEYYRAIKCGLNYLERYPEINKSLPKVYRLIANNYCDVGDYHKAVINYDKSIYTFTLLENEIKAEHTNARKTGICSSVFDVFFSSKISKLKKDLIRTMVSKLDMLVELYDTSYSKEIEKIDNELSYLIKEYNTSYKNKFAKELSLGNYYDFINDLPKARKYYLNALKLSLDEEDSIYITKTYINLSVVSKKEDSIEKAKNFLTEAEKYDDGWSQDLISNNFADLYLKEGKFKNALIYYQKTITQALHSKELPYQTLPKFEDIELSPNKIDILGYLIDKSNGWIAYYEAEKNAKYLENSLETFALADSLVDVIYFESREDLSKLFWRKKSATFYPKAVEVCYRLQQPEKAFFFMEKNKAILLLENMTDATAKRLSKLPKEILKREQDLIKKIKTLEGEIQMSSYTESRIDTLKDNIFDYKKELNVFIDSLETNYPKYYKYKKNKKVVTLQEVQRNLQKDELILQYIVGKEKGFVTLISPETIQLKELPSTARLRETVATYKNAVSKPFVNVDDKNKYEEVATLLYQQLFPFSETLSQKQMTIIPDDVLQYIPFEALRTPTNEYLIEDTQIQYNYSLSSAAQSQQNRMSSGSSFIAIAPTKFQDEQYATLTTSSAELEKLTRIFGANHFQYENATKKRFTEAYGNYKIVHLSTHGGLDNTIPWLAFYDEKITLDELYFTKNQSELVVLSACKTSDGELKKGEGVMSLARGFFNAGAKSVISSLWDINEKASTEIIEEFYKNIVAGDSKSEALQKAKLTYIQNNENTSEASPYYWSALTLTGDESPIKLSGNGYLYYIFGGILLTGIVLYIRRKRNKKEVA